MTKPQQIAVIGAGIMGLSAAYELCRRDHAITLFDPSGFTSANASALAGGMLAPLGEIEHMSADWLSAARASLRLWQEDLSSIAQSADFRQSGSLLVAHAQDHHMLARFAAHLEGQSGWRQLPAQSLEPALDERFPAALYLEEEAHLNPGAALRAFQRSLEGRTVLRQKKVAPADLHDDFDFVLDCRGMGAQEDEPGLRGVKGEMAVVRNPDFRLDRPVRLMHPRYPLYIVPRGSGVFMIGATVIEASSDEAVSVRAGLELLSALYSLHPSFGEAQILDMRAGVRPAYTDNLPRLRQKKNIISCNGLFRHGWLLAPLVAQTAAKIIDREDCSWRTLLMKGERDENHHQRAA